MNANAITTAGEEMLDLQQAAAALGVSKSQMEAWTRGHKPQIAKFKVGRVVRIERIELARFVLANTIRCRRPDWLSGAVEGEFEKKLRELAARELEPLHHRLETIERFLALPRRALAA